MKRIQDMMGEAIGRPEVLKAARAQRVMKRWNEVVGDFLATKSEPDKFEHGVLSISTSGSEWAQELRLQKNVILAKLNEHAGENLFTGLRISTRKPRRDWDRSMEL